jgi:hypothetical protein
VIHTPSRMHGKTMVVAAFLHGDLATGCFPFTMVDDLRFQPPLFSPLYMPLAEPVTYSTMPSYCCSDAVVCDLSGVTSVWFGTIPLTLGASSGFSGHEGFPASLACWLCPTSDISISMPTIVVCWVSSTTGVGLPGSILGEGILSKLRNCSTP